MYVGDDFYCLCHVFAESKEDWEGQHILSKTAAANSLPLLEYTMPQYCARLCTFLGC